jgi:hypothetical protein
VAKGSQLWITPKRNLPPNGFRYAQGLIEPVDEAALLQAFQSLPFKEFEFHGFAGKRRVVSFGWRYDFNGGGLQKTEDIPPFLRELRAKPPVLRRSAHP